MPGGGAAPTASFPGNSRGEKRLQSPPLFQVRASPCHRLHLPLGAEPVFSNFSASDRAVFSPSYSESSRRTEPVNARVTGIWSDSRLVSPDEANRQQYVSFMTAVGQPHKRCLTCQSPSSGELPRVFKARAAGEQRSAPRLLRQRRNAAAPSAARSSRLSDGRQRARTSSFGEFTSGGAV